MADKYCKKSSLEAVADEVRTRAGYPSSLKMTPLQMVDIINNLEIPVQRGAPNVELTVNSPSYTIPKGVYTGGLVYVLPQGGHATLTANGSTVSDPNGRPLSSVTVPPKNVYTVHNGTTTPSSGATTINFTGLNFKPVGIILAVADWSSKKPVGTNNVVSMASVKGGSTYGCLGISSSYCGVITSASVTFTDNSVTISNIVANRNGSTVSGSFCNNQHYYIIWGV